MQDREEFKDVRKLYSSIHGNFKNFETENMRVWEQAVEESTGENLNKFLLFREESETV
jgi:hypothetical protein